ncbi:MAG: hypothetical protein JWR39_1185 [Devosia sp.]|nr:hypothetical protein [Devosia sp.]
MFLSAHDTRGGTTNYIGTLRDHLVRLGLPCRRVALYKAFISETLAYDDVLLPQQKLSLPQYLSAMVKFIAHVRRERPQAVLAVMPLAGVAAGLAGLVTGTPAINTHHSPYDKNGRLVRLLDKLVGTLGGYRQIVCVSQAVADSYARHPKAYRDRLLVIPNGVPHIAANADRAQTFAKLGLPPSLPVVFMAGRLAPQKNVLIAVEAVAKVEGVVLAMSGDGPLRGELLALAQQRGISERVHLLGQIDRQDLVNLMFSCDAFMQISRFEGQSMALLEAAYAGAAPIVSNIPVQREVITTPSGQLAGIACDPQDPADVARAIAALVLDPQHRDQVRANLKELRPFVRTERQMLEDYEQLLRPLVAGAEGAAGMASRSAA